ncbi:MAG TPA: nucleotidyltransferase domain-containing protein [Candidatus Nanoarchaeia archaeon]|nr:nucleotidyltransferase domain-containing protein [Candidatus Nanoarchaeia archaeon]
MPKIAVRKHRVRHFAAVDRFIAEVDKKYGDKIISIIAMGSWGTEEATEEGDVDLEVVFDSDFFRPELTEELCSLTKELGLKDKIEVWALSLNDIEKQNLKFKNYPKNVLLNHLSGTGLTLKGENLLKHLEAKYIPDSEIVELLEVAERDFGQGNLAKAVLKSALCLIYERNGNKPLEIKNLLYYRSISEAAQKYLDEKDFAVVYRALRAKRGLGKLDKAETNRFLKTVEKKLNTFSAN